MHRKSHLLWHFFETVVFLQLTEVQTNKTSIDKKKIIIITQVKNDRYGLILFFYLIKCFLRREAFHPFVRVCLYKYLMYDLTISWLTLYRSNRWNHSFSHNQLCCYSAFRLSWNFWMDSDQGICTNVQLYALFIF